MAKKPKEITTSIAQQPTEQFRESPLYGLAKSAFNQVEGVYRGMVDFYKDIQKEKKPMLYYDIQRLMMHGVIYRPFWRIPHNDLRWISYSSSLIGAIHQIRTDDASSYHRFKLDPGFDFVMKEIDKKPSGADLENIKALGHNVSLMGKKEEGWRERDKFHHVIQMFVRDMLSIDRIAFQVTRNRRGEVMDILYLDPATIFAIDPSRGYDGDKSITHVQVVDGRIVEQYEKDRIILRHRSMLSDIKMRDHGFSPTESCVLEIMGMLYGLKDNMDRFNGRNPPKGFFTSEAMMSEDEQRSLELQWENAFYGPRMNFKLPFLFGAKDIQYHPLQIESDIQFDKLIQLTAQLILARHGMDAAELGIRLAQSGQGGISNEASMDGRQKFSRDRAHGAQMFFLSSVLNEIYDPDDELSYRLEFIGVKTDDEDKQIDRDTKKLKAWSTIDEIRKAQDMPTIGEILKPYADGDKEMEKKLKNIGGMILDPYVAQAYNGIVNAQQPGMEEGGGGFSPEDEAPYDDQDSAYNEQFGGSDGEEEEQPEQPGEQK